VGHFEKQQKGELFDVIAVGEAVIAEDVAVVPEFVDESGRGGGHANLVALRDTGTVLKTL
jgi:hypothetical protein